MRRLVLGIVIAGCGSGGGDLPAVAASVAPLPARDAAPPLPATTRRLDLAPVPASMTLPVAATVKASSSVMRDRDGFLYAAPVATITGLGADLRISMMDPYADMPTSLAKALADNARRATPFRVMGTKESADGAWAAAFQWKKDGTCHMSGGLAAAQVWCAPVALAIDCDVAQKLVDACASLEPAATPLSRCRIRRRRSTT